MSTEELLVLILITSLIAMCTKAGRAVIGAIFGFVASFGMLVLFIWIIKSIWYAV